MTNMEDYGKVLLPRRIIVAAASPDRSGGECYGSGRGAMKDGTFSPDRFRAAGKEKALKLLLVTLI